MREAVVGNGGIAKLQCLQIFQILQIRQTVVAHEHAAAQIEQSELVHVLEFGQSVVADVVEEQRKILQVRQILDDAHGGVGHGGAAPQIERLEQGKLAENFEALVGNFGVFENQIGKLGKGGQFGDAGIGDFVPQSESFWSFPAPSEV